MIICRGDVKKEVMIGDVVGKRRLCYPSRIPSGRVKALSLLKAPGINHSSIKSEPCAVLLSPFRHLSFSSSPLRLFPGSAHLRARVAHLALSWRTLPPMTRSPGIRELVHHGPVRLHGLLCSHYTLHLCYPAFHSPLLFLSPNGTALSAIRLHVPR